MNRWIKSLLVSGFMMIISGSCESFEHVTVANTFFQVRSEGTVLPVWVKGNTASGKFILFINGGPGLTSIDVARADMFQWSRGLEEHFSMVYYDQRGCGNAQGQFDESSLTIDQYVSDLDAIVNVIRNRFDDPELYLMGHSFGGFIGIRYLLKGDFQEKIEGWISIDGAYNFDFDLSWQYRRTFLVNIAEEEIQKGNNLEHWEDALAWTERNPVIATRQQKDEWRGYIGWPGGIIIPEELADLSVRQYLSIGFASSYNPVPAYLSPNLEIVNDRLNEDAEGQNLIEAVSAVTIPALLLWGRYDDLIVPEEGQAVYLHFGTAPQEKFFVLLPESSHEPYISDPEHFKSEVIDFVSNH